MTVQDAMRLIDQEVVGGSEITIKEHPPFTIGPINIPVHWTAWLRPVWVSGVAAAPACTAYSQEKAIIGIGEFLAGAGRV